MSQKELNEQDDQVMSMVNRAAAPDSAKNADAIAQALGEGPQGVSRMDLKLDAGRISAGVGSPKAEAEKWRKLLYLALRAVICLLIACVFMAAAEQPIFAQTLCIVGFLAALMTGAIIVDRHFRR